MKSTIWITKHEGKMDGIRSISTNPLTNSYCRTMHDCGKDNIICTKCYATNLVSFRQSLQSHVEDNSKELSSGVLTLEALPRYTDELMRFHSFGELINYAHVINIFNICYVNPMTQHVIYSKRCNILEEMSHLKPNNLKIIESNPLINAVYEKPKSRVADMVFNVVTPDYLEKHPEYTATCKMACNSCRLCYTKRTPMKFIVEMLK